MPRTIPWSIAGPISGELSLPRYIRVCITAACSVIVILRGLLVNSYAECKVHCRRVQRLTLHRLASARFNAAPGPSATADLDRRPAIGIWPSCHETLTKQCGAMSEHHTITLFKPSA